MNLKYLLLLGALAFFGVTACDNPDDTGLEFAPNMYNSQAYESQTQWRPNKINENGMNMRLPAEGTISRRNYSTQFVQDDSTVLNDLMLYKYTKDDLVEAGLNLKNPIPYSEATEKEGKILYERFCQHCHGGKGAGDGLVGKKYAGVPNYASDALKDISEGHIFHVMTFGKGRMWPHASQVSPEDRWKIVHYVQRLQLGN